MAGVVGPNIVFTGANIHIVDGSGSTDDNGGALRGLGNLVIGYVANGNGQTSEIEPRTGSHNLIIGAGNGFTSFGGSVAGEGNEISGGYADISGGCLTTPAGNPPASAAATPTEPLESMPAFAEGEQRRERKLGHYLWRQVDHRQH
jgi:hypothetical protein